MPTAGRTGWRVALPLDAGSRTYPGQGPGGHNRPSPTAEPFLTGKALELEPPAPYVPRALASPQLLCGSLSPGGWYLGHCSPQSGKGSLEEGCVGGLCSLWAGEMEVPIPTGDSGGRLHS